MSNASLQNEQEMLEVIEQDPELKAAVTHMAGAVKDVLDQYSGSFSDLHGPELLDEMAKDIALAVMLRITITPDMFS